MRGFLAGLLVAAAVGGSSSAAQPVGPPPLAAVGLIESAEGRPKCTGTLIRADLVLTAGHCVKGRIDGRPVTGADLVFSPGSATGRPLERFPGRRAVVHPFYDLLRLMKGSPIRYDLALIELARPVPADMARPLPIAAATLTAARGQVRSFRLGDGRQARQKPCDLGSRDGGIITATCEVRGGESGSPFLVREDGGLSVLGVVVATTRRGRTPSAIVVDLARAGPSLFEAFRVAGQGG